MMVNSILFSKLSLFCPAWSFNLKAWEDGLSYWSPNPRFSGLKLLGPPTLISGLEDEIINLVREEAWKNPYVFISLLFSWPLATTWGIHKLKWERSMKDKRRVVLNKPGPDQTTLTWHELSTRHRFWPWGDKSHFPLGQETMRNSFDLSHVLCGLLCPSHW